MENRICDTINRLQKCCLQKSGNSKFAVEVPDFLEGSFVPGLSRSEDWPIPFGFRDKGPEGATVSLKFLENSALIFYYVRKVLTSFEGTQAFDQEEDIDGNR